MNDDYGDYVPPEGDKASLKFKDSYTAPTGSEIPITFTYIYYHAPQGDKVALNFSGAYTPPDGDKVPLEFSESESGPGGIQQYLFPAGIYATLFGEAYTWRFHTYVSLQGLEPPAVPGPEIFLYARYVRPSGFFRGGYGRPTIINRNRTVRPNGIPAGAFGWTTLVNWDKNIYPPGFNAFASDRPYVWNLLQRRYLTGFNASRYGVPFMRGGVKYVRPGGRSYMALGRPTVINLMADQYVSPKGLAPPGFGSLSVSPRMLYPNGIYRGGYGEPVVQFPPFPVGWESSRTGLPEIDYRTKYLTPDGMDPGERIGYPFVRDRAQRILAPSLTGTGVFGDIRIVNRSLFIYVPGEDYFAGSDWAELRSNRRLLEGRGFDTQAFGGTEIWNKTPSIVPLGIPPIPVSPHNVGYRVRYLYGRGFHNTAYGRATLTKTPSISPAGFSGQSGQPTVWYRVRNYDLNGINSLRLGTVTVWLRVRPVQIQGNNHSRYGTPRFDHSLRTMLVSGTSHDRHGKPRVQNADRTLTPSGIFEEFPVVHMVGGTRWLQVFGFVATRFGTRIIPPIQQVFARGFANSYGQAEVYNQTQIPLPTGFTNLDRWGVGRVFNSIQHVDLYYFHESGLNPPEWPRWTKIENRSKELGVIGYVAQRFGNATAYNNARLVALPGIKAPSQPDFYRAGMVAYRIRELPLQGLEAPYLSSWSRIYNDAFVLAPAGFRSDVQGRPAMENTRRYFDRIGGFVSEAHGLPMIADRIREIEFEPRYSIAPPRINLHIVDLYTRYVDGLGDDLSGVGLPSLMIRFNRITTRWTHRELMGWADVRNLTPEVGTRGRASDEYGNTFVRLQWRPVNPDGSGMELFGKAAIADRDRSMEIRGFNAGSLGDKLKVIKTGQPPYTEQYIFLFKVNEEGEQSGTGYGIPPPGGNFQVSAPALNQYVLYASGFRADRYGTAFCQSNAIIVDIGIWDDGYGRPFVGLKDRKFQVGAGPDHHAVGEPRITPHTIWARPAPAQANANHPINPWHPVGRTRIYPPGERFGRQRISTWRGDVRQRLSRNHAAYGTPRVYLKLRYIEVPGMRMFRMGWHKLGDGTQDIIQFASSRHDLHGRPKVEREPYTGPQTTRPSGLLGAAFGSHRVEHFHREIFPSGRNMLGMGQSRGGTPYKYQGLAVHPPMPTIPEGLYAASYGEPWVSPRVRELHPEGFDMFVSEYDLTNFDGRMRVRNAVIPVPDSQEASPVGLDVSALGVPNIRPGTYFIRPDGNSDQYRKGAF